jgi:hypothetical protein
MFAHPQAAAGVFGGRRLAPSPGGQLAFHVVHELEVQLEQPVQEPGDDEQVLRAMRQTLGEDVAERAGLIPGEAFDLSWAYEYPDAATLGRAMMAPAGISRLVGPEREDEVRAAIVEGLEPYRTPAGGYRLENEFHFLLATA